MQHHTTSLVLLHQICEGLLFPKSKTCKPQLHRRAAAPETSDGAKCCEKANNDVNLMLEYPWIGCEGRVRQWKENQLSFCTGDRNSPAHAAPKPQHQFFYKNCLHGLDHGQEHDRILQCRKKHQHFFHGSHGPKAQQVLDHAMHQFDVFCHESATNGKQRCREARQGAAATG